MLFDEYTEVLVRALMSGQEEARELGQTYVGTESMMLGLLNEPSGVACKAIRTFRINKSALFKKIRRLTGSKSAIRIRRKQDAPEMVFTERGKRVMDLAIEECRVDNSKEVDTEHFLLALISEGSGVGVRALMDLGVSLELLEKEIRRIMETGRPEKTQQEKEEALATALAECTVDLTKQALLQKLDPTVGRAKEIEQIMQILGRRRKNNPIIIGDPGVGKTALVEGLAQYISSKTVPALLKEKRILALDMSSIVAGTKYRGEFEEKLKEVMDAVIAAKNIILFIDEIHTLVGAGAAEGSIDAANMLKPALSRGEIQCIGATTQAEYRDHIETEPALNRRFQKVTVSEPDLVETVEILYGLKARYEKHHLLLYSDEAIVAAATLSKQYIPDRFLPDKAIDLLDEAGSKIRLSLSFAPASTLNHKYERQVAQLRREKNAAVIAGAFDEASKLNEQEYALVTFVQNLRKFQEKAGGDMSKLPNIKAEQIPVVTEEHVADVISTWTDIPLRKITEDESAKLLSLESELHVNVIGQDAAVNAVSRALRRSRVGLKNPNRPIASFIFAGPTGVGKTELTKIITEHYFGNKNSLVRLDMSEYMEKHSIAKLIGSPPGYVGYSEGGLLTEAVRKRPFSVVLFDEIEKAHLDIYNILLQILEDGHLTDSKGLKIDFKNTLIILTSNVGSKIIERHTAKSLVLSTVGLSEVDAEAQNREVNKLVHEELKKYFRPEFLNRLDEIIVFNQLKRVEVAKIAELMLDSVNERLKTKQMSFRITDKFRKNLLEEGYNPTYGARPMRRAITNLVEDKLAEFILANLLPEDHYALLDIEDNVVKITTHLDDKSNMEE